MSKYPADTITADGRSQALSVKNSPRESGASVIKTIFVTGTFGGGTATLQASPDNGTTWVDVLDQSGSAVAFTANKACNVEIASDGIQPVKVSLNLAGATSPSLEFVIFDAS